MKKLIAFAIMALLLAPHCAFYTKGARIAPYGKPQSALLILDIQNDFTGKNARMPVDPDQASQIIETTNSIIGALDRLKLIPVYIGNEFEPDDSIANWIRNGAAVRGSAGAKLDERLKIAGNHYFAKNYPDAFSSVKLNQFLTANEIDHIYIVGLYANACVYWTIKGALNRGYRVTVIKDGIADKSNAERDAAIKKFIEQGVHVVSLEGLLASSR